MTNRRASALAASVLLVAWALCVPLLHGHLPTGTAHVHGGWEVSSAGSDAAHEVLGADREVTDGHRVTELSGSPLPIVTADGAFALVVVLTVALVAPRGVARLRRAAGRVGWPARASPVTRFEVVRV